MKNCLQTEGQSIYEHGISVKNHYFNLLFMLKENSPLPEWRLPDWFLKYREEILKSLLSEDIIEQYTVFHDCGKPYCLILDENGRRHFPNHAEKSYEIWLQASGNLQAAKLMKMDMIIHTIKANEIDDFIKNTEAITLLLAGLAEVHSNSKLFGGIESESFKIKWKQIDKRGNAIMKKLFGEKKNEN
jgi:hypothetical protein